MVADFIVEQMADVSSTQQHKEKAVKPPKIKSRKRRIHERINKRDWDRCKTATVKHFMKNQWKMFILLKVEVYFAH